MIQGRIGGEDVILARRGDEFFGVGAYSTHYHGPLQKGLILGDEMRCPLHHVCFSLRTGLGAMNDSMPYRSFGPSSTAFP